MLITESERDGKASRFSEIFETETTQHAADAPLDSSSETESLTADISTKVVQDQTRRPVTLVSCPVLDGAVKKMLHVHYCAITVVIDCLASLIDCRHDAEEVQQAHDLIIQHLQ